MEWSEGWCRVVISGKSQTATNRNLIRLISNLSRLNWSSERNSVYCFQQCLLFYNRKKYLSTRNLTFLVFESSNTFMTYTWLRQTGQQHSFSFFGDKHLPAYPAHSAFIRHCSFNYNIINDIQDHSTSSRNRNRGNRRNIKSRQRGPTRLRLCFLHPDLSLTEWVTLPARVSAHAPQLSLSPSHYFLPDLMENMTSKSLLGY